jgi:hypothetical protein
MAPSICTTLSKNDLTPLTKFLHIYNDEGLPALTAYPAQGII